jgi:NitT/TauT family transport system substrate-binding protein
MNKKWIGVAIAAIFACVVLIVVINVSNNSEGEPTQALLTEVRIGYQPTIFYSYLFLAEERGMFKQAGLSPRFTKIPSANKMVQALLAEQLDMTGLTATEIMFREYEESPGTFVCPILVEVNDQDVTDWILVLKDSPIQSIADLAGKTVGSHPGTAVPNVMRRVLETNGVDLETVTIQPKKPATQAESLLSGAVDALICLEPTGTRLMLTGKCRVLMEHPFGVIETAFPGAYSILSKKFIDAHPEAAKRLVGVIKDAVNAYREQGAKDRSVLDALVAEKLELEPDVAAKSSLATYRLPAEWDEEVFGRIVDYYIELQILSKTLTTAELKL